MRFNPIRSAATWLCLAAYLLVGAVGSRGMVLCVGPGGHVAIEVAPRGDCAGCLVRGERDAVGARERAAGPAPACPCDDVTLDGALQIAQRRSLERAFDGDLRAPPASLPCARPPNVWRDTFVAFARSASAIRAARSRPRSVVLLV
jgi:hypothetical protein